MKSKLYHLNEVYFRVKYFDKWMKYPLIESFLYVGKNISIDDIDDEYFYFQFLTSFIQHGSVVESDMGDRAVVRMAQCELTHDMFDIDDLSNELLAAKLRRHQ